MKVIVDTAVWSLAFRRRTFDAQSLNDPYRDLLRDLIHDGRVELLAVVRQEVLSGLRHQEQFERLKLSLRAFPNMPLDVQDYELAAQFFNLCRAQGVQGANTDFLICAASVHHHCEILTTDKDFELFAKLLPITLHSPTV